MNKDEVSEFRTQQDENVQPLSTTPTVAPNGVSALRQSSYGGERAHSPVEISHLMN